MAKYFGTRNSVFLLLGLAGSMSAFAVEPSSPSFVQDVVAFHYPPFMIDDHSNEKNGLEIDILKAALGKVDFKLRYRFYPIPRATQAILHSELNNHLSFNFI